MRVTQKTWGGGGVGGGGGGGGYYQVLTGIRIWISNHILFDVDVITPTGPDFKFWR